GELPRLLAAGLHAPDFQGPAAVADEDDRSLELGQLDLALGHGRGAGGWFRRRGRGPRCLGKDLAGFGDTALSRPSKAIAVGAEAGVRVGRELLVAVGGAALVRGAVPGAAAQHTHLTGGRAGRSALTALGVIVVAVPVIAPLPDVAVHVMQAPAVGLLFA